MTQTTPQHHENHTLKTNEQLLAALAQLPKAMLHEHLDGGLRAQTLLDWGQRLGVTLPHHDADTLGAWMADNAHSGSLENYLRGFALTVAAMSHPDAAEQVALEAAQDASADGCILAEFRMAPSLLAGKQFSTTQAAQALMRGLQQSPIPCGLIFCAMRHQGSAHSLEMAQIAISLRDAGWPIVAFDLAGPEQGFPPALHQAALQLCQQAHLPITCHAGEADRGERVLEAISLGAQRIGHGVRIMPGLLGDTDDDAAHARWIERAKQLKIHFEVCPSSNIHTGAVANWTTHPLLAMLESGLHVSCATDNRLLSRTSLSQELALAHTELGASAQQLYSFNRMAIEASFLPKNQKDQALLRLQSGWQDWL